MNSSEKNPRNNLRSGLIALGAILVAASSVLAAGKPKAIDVEIPYEATVLKTSLVSPLYLTEASGGMVVSDAAGGVYMVTMGGKSTELAGKSRVKHPAGVAIAPGGFGTAGTVYVLASGDDPAGPCEVDAIDKSGGVTTFAKLPDAGSGKAAECRDLEFGAKGTPYAGKLYAATSANSTIYAIDASGKAAVFGSYDKPNAWDLTSIGFTSATDSKAPNVMLIGMRLRMGGAAKLGRIGVVTPDGKLKDDPYLVGFIRPTGFGTSPANWGSYGDTFFIVDYGKPSTEEGGASDGSIYRVYKDVPRPYASNLADPTCMKFIGNKMVIADPAIKGAPGQGGIVIISSLL
ncbi:MAG TPA: hypothetical protein VMH37_06125 [Candidatus Binataceae bacterium]|nr:hypothetical protein [Candidatus Binataceae bacterium]